MSAAYTGKVPLAPYPPLVSSTRMEKGRDRSKSISQPSQGFASTKGNASSNHAGSIPKRQYPARVEFYNSTVYGAINCLGHNTDNSNSNGRSSNVRFSQLTNSLSRMNKLGPVLLELRCLYPRLQEEEDELKDDRSSSNKSIFSWYQGRTIALNRGVASLGVGVTSTCLSFRKNGDSSSFANNNINSSVEEKGKVHCATGLSSGSLCIHTLRNIDEYTRLNMEEDDEDIERTVLDSANSDDPAPAYFSHMQSRHSRPASAVAWRCGSNGGANSNHVAIGYNASSGDHLNAGPRSPTPMQRPGSDGYSGGFAFVWDVEAQSTASKGVKQVPIHKLAHHASVASLSWISDGQKLAIGCQHKNLQIHDLRMSGTAISTYAHDNSVNGISTDPRESNVFATFSRGLAEPVKLWDARKMKSCIAEIKTHEQSSERGGGEELPSFVSAIAWDPSAEGMLTIAIGGDLRYYNTRINLSRPVLSQITHSDRPLQCIAFPSKEYTVSQSPKRMIGVYTDGAVIDLPKQLVSPVDLSSRDGRVANAVGSHVYIGSTTEGAAAIEKSSYDPSEDISVTMTRRSRCLPTNRYSTDTKSNLQMLALEQEAFLAAKEDNIESDFDDMYLTSLEHLHLLWSWIERVETLCFRNNNDSSIGERCWSAKTLCDAGVLRLLRLDVANINEITSFESISESAVFNRKVYDSPLRRAALNACGWSGKLGLKSVLFNAESFGHFERSAALACWHGDLGETVAALQRGAEHIRVKMTQEEESKGDGLFTSQYAEALELVAMCVAGYNSGVGRDSNSTTVWKNACQNLLNRPNLTETKTSGSRSHLNYLRAICSFLIDDSDLDKTLKDASLNLSDRVAFACIYLARKPLKDYLESCVDDCMSSGNLEGLLITGLNKRGIALLQSYVDIQSDVQTVALVSSRAILPMDWVKERVACSEWLSLYREFLNKNQMWQSRAMFDVGRVELLRKLRDRQQQADEQINQNAPSVGRVLRRQPNQIRRHIHPSVTFRQVDNLIPNFPPQIHARCNYCNTALPLAKLRRQQNQQTIANNWLSKQKPVLSCCPNPACQKPLPRCAICLLPLGCLNPYMELRREGNRLARGSHGQQRGEDLSGLANMPFAEWFTWCATCHHGGHAHHYVSWFEKHDVCPVSNCNCRCQFDVVQKLKTPAATTNEKKRVEG